MRPGCGLISRSSRMAAGEAPRSSPRARRSVLGQSRAHRLDDPRQARFLEEAITWLSEAIEELEIEVALLDVIPGVERRIAECLFAEIGTDMARVSSSARLSS